MDKLYKFKGNFDRRGTDTNSLRMKMPHIIMMLAAVRPDCLSDIQCWGA